MCSSDLTAAPDNGEPLVSYVVTATPGNLTCTALAGPLGAPTTCAFTNLTNGIGYAFTVVAFNVLGSSLASLPSPRVTPAGVPFAPDFASAVRGDGEATVSWTASNGNGSPITSYTVVSTPDNKSCTTTGASCVVKGLTNGTTYTFLVSANNAVGVSTSATPTNAIKAAGQIGRAHV